MRAFVAGATGLTGRNVVRTLVELGQEVYAHVRPDSSGGEAATRMLEGLGGKVDRTPWLQAAMNARLQELQPDLVFALLGTTRARMQRTARDGGSESYESVDFGLTKLLLDAAVNCGKAPRFVYLSAVGARESARGAYYRARAKAEASVEDSGLPYLIARPSFIIGDRDERRLGESLAAGASDALLSAYALLGGGRTRARYASMTGEELARGIVRAALEAKEPACIAEAEDLRNAARAG